MDVGQPGLGLSSTGLEDAEGRLVDGLGFVPPTGGVPPPGGGGPWGRGPAAAAAKPLGEG